MRALKLLMLISCFVISSIACNQNKSNKDNQGEQPTEKQTTNKTKSLQQEKQMSHGIIFKTHGRFSTADDKINLHVPVSSDQFSILEIQDISVKERDSINAIIIRVSDGSSTSRAGQAPTHQIDSTISISKYKLNRNELQKDKELIVFTFNSMNSFTDDEIEILKKCIEDKGSYADPEACIYELRKETIKEDIFRPNDRQGSILKGT